MDYDDDDALKAPVWDELDQTTQFTPIPELSATLSNLNTEEANQEQLEVEEEEEEKEEKEEGKKKDGRKDNHATENLLNTLAPEEDPLASLTSEANVFGSKDLDAPLFDSVTSPINMDNTNTSHEFMSTSTIKSNKPQKLFNAARIRRRPTENLNTEQKQNEDPLGKTLEENEFTDEPLDDVAFENHSSIRSNILEQMDKPLFQLSPKKKTLDGTEKSEIPRKNEESVATSSEETNESNAELKSYKISVKDPIKVGELTSVHVEYTVITESVEIESGFAQVNRRYTDFRWLYRQLQNNHWGKIIPPPPEKQVVGRFKSDFLESRRLQMQGMLVKIASDPQLQNDQDFLFFLTSDNFSSDSKVKTYVSGSGAYNDNNDLSEIHISEIKLLGTVDAANVLKNGGLDGLNKKGFMNLSFTSLPKYIEPDPYFIEQGARFDTLEEQLRHLYKSLEFVDIQRNELASLVEEFAGMINQLAELEVTKQSSDLLCKFAEVQTRIKESLERNSLQESITMGATLDDYVRSLSSVRATFNQRNKLGYFLLLVENDLNKKKSQLDKLRAVIKKSNSTDNEKYNVLLEEANAIEKRYQKINKSWQEVAKVIKKEVQLFNREKITEFRNSMEISLEAAIESQKECIELWETFHQTNL